MIGFMTHLDTFLDERMSEFYGKQRVFGILLSYTQLLR